MDDTDSYIYCSEKEIIYSYGFEVTGQESYVLSGSCMNTVEANEYSSSDSLKYIYLKTNDTCFYIIDLAPQYLTLSFVGRGNTFKNLK